jgi:hypothetical protein
MVREACHNLYLFILFVFSVVSILCLSVGGLAGNSGLR